jgi:hypothetical protein
MMKVQELRVKMYSNNDKNPALWDFATKSFDFFAEVLFLEYFCDYKKVNRNNSNNYKIPTPTPALKFFYNGNNLIK